MQPSGAAYGALEQPASQDLRKPRTKAAPRKKTELSPLLLCRFCGNHITDEDRRISVNGGHRHTFANPHGHVFEIGCFHSAVGCAAVDAFSDEFTWFPGYAWRVAPCMRCAAHMGWFFSSPDRDAFWGLILDRLIHSA